MYYFFFCSIYWRNFKFLCYNKKIFYIFIIRALLPSTHITRKRTMKVFQSLDGFMGFLGLTNVPPHLRVTCTKPWACISLYLNIWSICFILMHVNSMNNATVEVLVFMDCKAVKGVKSVECRDFHFLPNIKTLKSSIDN